MNISQIAFKFFREFTYPDQIADMARDHLPAWLTLRKIPADQHEEAIAVIRATAKELLKTRDFNETRKLLRFDYPYSRICRSRDRIT